MNPFHTVAAAAEQGLAVLERLDAALPAFAAVSALAAVAGLARAVRLAGRLRAAIAVPRRFPERFRDAVRARRWDEARDLCGRRRSAWIAVAAAALPSARRGARHHELLERWLDDEARRQAAGIARRVRFLADLAAIAPVLGFAGATAGALYAFLPLSLATSRADPDRFAAGLAMIALPVAAGLAVALPALVFIIVFAGRTSRALERLNEAPAEIVSWLAPDGAPPNA